MYRMNIVIKIREEKFEDLWNFFSKEKTMIMQKNSVNHVFFMFKNENCGVTVTLFKSGKLLINGKGAWDFIDRYDLSNFSKERIRKTLLKKEDKESIDYDLLVLGGDESGKGDTFGGMSFAMVFCDEESLGKVKSIAKDSKKIKDEKIKELANIIKSVCFFREIYISPEDFNKKNKSSNISDIMNIFYEEIIDGMLPAINKKCRIVIDKYPAKKEFYKFMKEKYREHADVVFLEKADTISAPVSCASILARNLFLQKLDTLRNEWGISFPKGSVHVDEFVKAFYLQHGKEALSRVAKISFKNVKKILRD